MTTKKTTKEPALTDEILKSRREKALGHAIDIVSNPIFTLNNNPLNRDLRAIMMVADVLILYMEGKDYRTALLPPQHPGEEVPSASN